MYKLVNWMPEDKIDWDLLCLNPSPGAIQLLAENPDKIYWNWLSKNPAAIHLIETNLDKLKWNCWSSL